MNINYAYNTDTNILLKEIMGLIKRDVECEMYKNVLVITPENIKDDLELFIKKEEIIDPNLKIKISNISDLVKSINKNRDRIKKKINPIQDKIIIQSALNDKKESLSIYGQVSNEAGFIDSMFTTINAIDSNTEKETLKKIEDLIDNPILKSKIKDINLILEQREEKISEYILNNREFYLNASNLIKRDNIYEETSIIFTLFEEITPVELEVIKSIVETSAKTTFAIKTNSIDRTPSVKSLQFFKLDYMINELKNKVESNAIDVNSLEEEVNKEVGHIGNYLYKYPFSVYKEKTDYVYINNYKSIEDEIINVSLSIKDHVNKLDDISYGDISIVVPNLQQKSYLIAQKLKEFGIPSNLEGCNSNTNDTFIKDLILIKDLISSNFETKAIINYLRCCNNSFNQEDIFILESFFLKNLITNIDYENETWVDRVEAIDEDSDMTELKEKADVFIKPIYSLTKEILNCSNNKDICIFIYKFISEIKNNIESRKTLSQSDVIAWNSIIRTLENISKSNEISQITLEQLLDILISESKKLNTDAEKLKVDSVSVIDISNFNKVNPKIIYLLDLNEGVMPSSITNSTLFTNEDIEILSHLGVHIEPTATEKILNERFAVYSCLSRARNRIYLSYLDVDKDGKLISPSQTVERLKQIFVNYSKLNTLEEKLKLIDTNEVNIKIPTDLATVKIASEINKGIDNINVSSIPDIENIQPQIDIIKNSLEYKNSTSFSNRNKLNNLYFSDTLSVSKLERYSKCHFAYFAEIGLKLNIPEVNKPDARHRGIFIHTIIETFGKEIQSSKMEWEDVDETYIKEKVKSISDKLIKKNQFKVFTLSKKDLTYVKAMEDIAIISLKAIKEHLANSFFEPIGHELSFGEKNTYPPIMLKLPSGKRIKIRGQIDRADNYNRRGTDYIRVIDYKTGDTSVNFSDIFYGLQLQLFVYLNALLENHNTNDVIPAGVFYLNLHNPIIKTNPTLSVEDIEDYRIKELKMKGIFCNEEEIPQAMDKGIYDQEYTSSKYIQAKFKTDGTLSKVTPGLTAEDIVALYTYTKEKTIELAEQMILGDISINPIKKNNYQHCNYCKYHSICLFDETVGINKMRYLQEIQKGDAIAMIREKVFITNE